MKRWLTKPLGELLKVQNGFAFKSELFNDDGKGLPIIRIRDLARGFSETFYNGKHDSEFEVEKGDFLIGMDGEFRCYRWQGGKALLNQRVCRLQNFSRDLNASYVFYGINEHLRKIEDSTAFVTVKHLSSKQIASIEMAVPPFVEQERIVKLLDEADELRKLRVQADTRTNALLPALFNEMFGDPVKNPKGWPMVLLVETTSPKQWPTITQQQLTESGYPVYGANGKIGFYSEFNHVEETVLITCRGATCGTINVCEPKSYVTGNAMSLDDPNPALLTVPYLASVLRVRGVHDTITGSAQPQITRQSLARVSFPAPPLPLQKEFAQRVTEIREVEAAQAASRCRTEDLFQSMLHKAFNGEL